MQSSALFYNPSAQDGVGVPAKAKRFLKAATLRAFTEICYPARAAHFRGVRFHEAAWFGFAARAFPDRSAEESLSPDDAGRISLAHDSGAERACDPDRRVHAAAGQAGEIEGAVS